MAVSYQNYICPIVGMNPNWESPITTKFVWKTAIAESLAGYEKRIACYARPIVKTSFHLTNVEARYSSYVRKLIDARGETAVGVPLWMDTCVTEDVAQVIGSNTILKVNARNRLFSWFKYALLWSDDFDFEVVQIYSTKPPNNDISYEHVRLYSMPSRTHDAGSLLVPLVFGKLIAPNSVYRTGSVSEIDIDFEEVPGWIGTVKGEDIYMTGGGPSQFGDNGNGEFETDFTFEPNWSSNPVQGLIDDIEYEPLDRGRALPRTFATKKRRTLAFSYYADRYQLQSVLNFFDRMDGRRGSFYVPTWTHDYKVTQAVAAGASAIPLERTGLTEMQDSYHALFKITDDGIGGRVLGKTILSQCDEIFIPTPDNPDNPGNPGSPFYPLEPGDVFSGAVKVRLMEDEIEVTSHSPNEHLFDLTFIETPQEYEGNTDDDGFASTYNNNSKEVYVYRFHRGTYSRIFTDYQGSLPFIVAGAGSGELRAQAADIRHTGIDLAEDSLANEMELEIAGEAATWLMEETDSPIDVIVYKGAIYPSYSSGVLTGYGATVTRLFDGRIVDFNSKGRIVSCILSSWLRVLQRNTPNVLVQRKCNRIFGSELCGVNRQSTLRKGTCNFSIPHLVGCNFTAHNIHFDFGEIPIDNYGNIVDSFWGGAKFILKLYDEGGGLSYLGVPTEYSGTIVRAYREEYDGNDDVLAFDFCGAADWRFVSANETRPVAETSTRFTLYPVCTGSIGSCAMFNNHKNFLGFPWIPNNNPLSSLEINYDARGKK